jgi:hypothetical protein
MNRRPLLACHQVTLEALGWVSLAVGLGLLFAAQVDAGMALRGLYADGVFYVARIYAHGGVAIVEPSRWTAQFIMQAPVDTGMVLGLGSPRGVALLFSLSTTLAPLLLTATCFWLLPKGERWLFLFPALVFLGGSMGSAFASVADGATAAAYAWVLFFLLRFAPLTAGHAAAILVLSLGALRLHEAMAYLGPILTATCLRRRALAVGARYERGLLVVAGLLALSSAIELGYILIPHTPGNQASFISDLLSLRWFFATGQGLNVPALLGLLGVAAVALALWRPLRWFALLGFAVVAAGVSLAVAVGELPAAPAAAFAARNNGALLSLPAMGLCLFLARHPARWPGGSAFPLLLSAMLALALAVIDFRATRDWRGYISDFETALRTERGVVPLAQVVSRLPRAQADAFARFSWPWTSGLMSLVLAPQSKIHTIIASPYAGGWEPMDPNRPGTWPSPFQSRAALGVAASPINPGDGADP